MFEAQLDEILLLAQKEKQFAEDFDSLEMSQNPQNVERFGKIMSHFLVETFSAEKKEEKEGTFSADSRRRATCAARHGATCAGATEGEQREEGARKLFIIRASLSSVGQTVFECALIRNLPPHLKLCFHILLCFRIPWI